jgi:hypothetical protein
MPSLRAFLRDMEAVKPWRFERHGSGSQSTGIPTIGSKNAIVF